MDGADLHRPPLPIRTAKKAGPKVAQVPGPSALSGYRGGSTRVRDTELPRPVLIFFHTPLANERFLPGPNHFHLPTW